VQWGHLALLLLIAGGVVAFLLDARATSLRINNLLLVQPAALIALVLAAIVLPQCFVRRRETDETESAADLARVAALAACFGLLAFGMEFVGFDVATFLFMAVGLWLCGERRWWVVLLFSAVFTTLLIWGYGALIPFPFPLLVL
jgi:hypothetical protein